MQYDLMKKNFLGKILAIASVFAITSAPAEARVSHKASAKARALKKTLRERQVRVKAPRVRKARPPRVRITRAPRARKLSPRQAAAQQHQEAQKAIIRQQQEAAHQAEVSRQQQEANTRQADIALQQQEAKTRAEQLRKQQEAAQEAEFARIAALAATHDPQVDVLTRFVLLHSFFVKNQHNRFIASGGGAAGGGLEDPKPKPISANIGYPSGISGTTDQYKQVGIPQAPVLFPYHLEDPANERGYVSPSFPINIKANYTRNFAPHDLHLNLGDVEDDNIDAFIVAQTLPWLGTSPVQFKPHSLIYPNVPNEGDNISHNFSVKAGIFSDKDNNGPLIAGQRRGRLIEENRLSVHTAGAGPNPRQVVSSGDVLPIVNLDLNQYNAESHVIFSLTKYRDPATGILKAAAVKHILLTEDDMRTVEASLVPPSGRRMDPITLDEFNTNIKAKKGFLSKDAIADEFDPYPLNRRP